LITILPKNSEKDTFTSIEIMQEAVKSWMAQCLVDWKSIQLHWAIQVVRSGRRTVPRTSPTHP